MNLMFLTRLSDQQQGDLLREAGRVALREAQQIAEATATVLGPLVSIDWYDHHRMNRLHEQQMAQRLSFIGEIPYGKSESEKVSLGPRHVEFSVKLSCSFEFAPQA